MISLNLSSSLRLDGKEEKGWRETGRGERSLMDDYDYVCYGKVYRFDEGVKGTDRVYVAPHPPFIRCQVCGFLLPGLDEHLLYAFVLFGHRD